jgi:hypothetical protein
MLQKVFGVPLDELLIREGRLTLGIPKIVEETVQHISEHGAHPRPLGSFNAFRLCFNADAVISST